MLKKTHLKLIANKNLLTYFLSFFASALGILLNFFLARFLAAESYGQIQYLVALVTTISQILIFGINSFLIREASNPKQINIFSKCFTLFIIIVSFTLPIIYYFLFNHATYTKANAYICVVTLAAAILMSMNTLISSFFQGSGNYKKSIIFSNLLPKLFLLSLTFVFYFFNRIAFFKEHYLLFYVIIYTFVTFPIAVKLIKKLDFSLEKRDLVSISLFFGVTITYSLCNNLAKVFEGGIYKNDVSLAIMSVSISIITLVRLVTSVLDNIVKPLFAKKSRENDSDGILELYRFETRINSYVAIPLYLFFILHSSRFLSIFGDSYLAYPAILIILSCANAVGDLTGPNGTMLAMSGHEKWELINGLVYFGTFIAFSFALSFDTVYGLCFSLLASEVVVNIIKYIEVYYLYKRAPLNLKTLISMVAVCAVDFAFIFPLRYINNFYIWLIVGFGTGCVLVALNFIISFYRKNDFKDLLSLHL